MYVLYSGRFTELTRGVGFSISGYVVVQETNFESLQPRRVSPWTRFVDELDSNEYSAV